MNINDPRVTDKIAYRIPSYAPYLHKETMCKGEKITEPDSYFHLYLFLTEALVVAIMVRQCWAISWCFELWMQKQYPTFINRWHFEGLNYYIHFPPKLFPFVISPPYTFKSARQGTILYFNHYPK